MQAFEGRPGGHRDRHKENQHAPHRHQPAQGDVAKRKATYSQLSKTLEGQAVWIWLFTANDYHAITSKVPMMASAVT